MGATPSSAAWAPTSRAATSKDAASPPREGRGREAAGADLFRAWAEESTRLCRRYVDEVVLAFGLCPWAAPALSDGRVVFHAFPPVEPEVSALLSMRAVLTVLDDLAERVDPRVDVALLTFPGHRAGWHAFDGFAERVRRADRARRVSDERCPFLVAMFHPDGAEESEAFSQPERLLSFLRRSPDPMLQLVRTDAVDGVKARHPGASDDVAQQNWLRLKAPASAGLSPAPRTTAGAAMAQALAALHHERDRAYARLAAGSSARE